jgi:ABC-type transport system involved in multi-copper enzyme maturation permease subunit
VSAVWAVARQMIAEGIRMKIALVFLALVVMIVLGLPFTFAENNSLTFTVQSFITYSLTATLALLGLLTIFLSRSLSDELVNRQIFLLMTKPIARWQFVLGKWLGITLMNAVFLAFSGLAMYGLVHYIKQTRPPIEPLYDAAELQYNVLVARHALKCRLPDFREPARREMEKNREEGLYANLPDFNPEAEISRLTKKYEARWRVVTPLTEREYEFENVLVDRSRTRQVQLRYKTEVSRYPPDEVFRALWEFGNPLKGTQVFPVPVRHVVGRYHTINVPVQMVADDNTLTVRFTNSNPFYPQEPLFRNVIEFRAGQEPEVLFHVGSFEGNLFRLLVINLCKLMFLAAVAILTATVFSFPVACLVSFTVYAFAVSRGFVLEGLDFASGDQATWLSSPKEFAIHALTFVMKALSFLIPDFARFNAVETLVNGRNVSLVWVLQAVAELVLVKTFVLLGLAMLVFQRREVAEVSI